MLARFAARREGRLALVLAASLSLTGCGFSKMQDILTDKPAKQEEHQQSASSPKPTSSQPTPADARQASPLALPPAQ